MAKEWWEEAPVVEDNANWWADAPLADEPPKKRTWGEAITDTGKKIASGVSAVGDEFGRLRDEVFTGVDNTKASAVTVNTAAQAAQLQKTNDRLAELMSYGEGDTPEAQGLRKTADFYSKRMPRMVGDMTEAQADAQRGAAMTTRPAVAAMGAGKTFGEAWDIFKANPYDVIAGVTATSLPGTVPALIVGAAMGPAAGAAAMGGSSAVTEAGSSIADFARESGVDTTDRKAVESFFANRENLAAAMSYAGKRAGIIGALDAASGGIAGKTLAPAFKSGIARQAVNVPTQMAVQAGMGAGGEAGAQIATKGRIDQPGQVVMEAAGELGGAPSEVAAFSKDARDAILNRGSAKPDPVQSVMATSSVDEAIAAATESVEPDAEPAPSTAIQDAGQAWRDMGIFPSGETSSIAARQAGQGWQDIAPEQSGSLEAQRAEIERAGAQASAERDARLADVGQQWQDLGITDPQDDLQAQRAGMRGEPTAMQLAMQRAQEKADVSPAPDLQRPVAASSGAGSIDAPASLGNGIDAGERLGADPAGSGNSGLADAGVRPGVDAAGPLNFSFTKNASGTVLVDGDPAAIRAAFPDAQGMVKYTDGKPSGVLFSTRSSPSVLAQLETPRVQNPAQRTNPEANQAAPVEAPAAARPDASGQPAARAEAGAGALAADGVKRPDTPADVSNREWAENYQKVTGDLSTASDKDIIRADGFAGKMITSYQRAAFAGDQSAKDMIRAIQAEQAGFKQELQRRKDAKPIDPRLIPVSKRGEPTQSLSKAASWVIKNKQTGEVIMETFDKKKVDALNTAKYEAVPIQEHLGGINKGTVADSAQSLKLETIAERLGFSVNKSKTGWHASGTMLSIPTEDADLSSAVSADHVFAHELGHGVMNKRGVSLKGFPVSALKEKISNWTELVAASKEFRPGVHDHESEKARAHAKKPNEIIADAIASVLIGEKPLTLLRPLMDYLGINKVDLGLQTVDEANAESRAAKDAEQKQPVAPVEREQAATKKVASEAPVTAKAANILTIEMGGSEITLDLGKPAWQATDDELVKAVQDSGAYLGKPGSKYDPYFEWRKAHEESIKQAAKDGETLPDEMLYDKPGLIRTDLNADQADLASDRMVDVYRATKDYAKAVQSYRDFGKAEKSSEPTPDSKPAAEMSVQELLRAAADKMDAVKPEAKAPIGDFGQKIGGAKKDTWTGFKDDLGAVSDDEIAGRKLSEIWPNPDYQKMIDDGMDAKSVAVIRALRDEIPAKPRSPYKVKRWAEQVKTMRDLAANIMDGKDTGAAVVAQLDRGSSQMRGIAGRVDLYMAVGHGKSLEGIRLSKHHYSLYRGRENVTLWVAERDAGATAFSNWPQELATGDTKEQAIEAFREKYDSLDAMAAVKKAEFVIFTKGGGDKGFYIGKKIGRNIADMGGPFDSLKDARAYREKNLPELEAKLAKYKEIPKERRDTNEPRVGEDMRNGQDVTPEMFAEAFGFKGVEFGNYVEQKRRQKDLNDSFDALMDMAAIMGVPAKAISLNGELGLAFGARGSGGVNPAAAHYESDKIVINLTKREGAGSLGHEWWHALDNYFSRMRGNRTSAFMTTATDVDLSARGSNYVAYPGVRKEMIDAFGEVVRSIKMTAIKARSSKIDAKRTKEYWTTGEEMAARAFESYLISKLHDQNASNDYLANVVDQKTWDAMAALGMENEDSYPYPTAGEMPVIRAGFDKFFQTLETKETDKGVAMFSRAADEDSPGLEAFAKADELFALPLSKAKDLEQIARDNGEEVTVRTTNLVGEKLHTLIFSDGTEIRISDRKANPYGQDQQVYAFDLVDGTAVPTQIGRPGENPEDVPPTDDVWVDVSRNSPANLGAKAYNIAMTYALNNDKIFVGDPAGLTDMALRRRTEQMLSHALKSGTARHLAPHPRQVAGDAKLGVPPLKWIYGDHVGNIERMIDVSLESLENGSPGAKDDTTYDQSTGEFRGKDGQVVPRFTTMGRSRERYADGLGKAQAGWRTLARAAYLRSFRGPDGRAEGSGILDRAGADAARLANNQTTGAPYSAKERIFYSEGQRAAVRNPSTVARVQAAVSELIGSKQLPNRLGRVVVTTSAEIKSTWEPLIDKSVNIGSEGDAGVAQAFYDPPTKTVFLIADHISQGNETAVAGHELMHKHGQDVLGKDGWDRMHSVIGTWENAEPGSQENAVYQYARSKVEAVGLELSNQELFPYAVEAAFKMGIKPSMAAKAGSVARWLESVRQNMKMVWAKITGKPETFKTQDLVDLAYGIAQRENPEYAMEDFRGYSKKTDDLFPEEFATKRTMGDSGVKITSKGDTRKGANVNSDGQQITATKQGVDNFWKWFGDSAAADAKGRPLVLYHSTNADFNTFEPGRDTINSTTFGDVETQRHGVFMSPDNKFSQEYLRKGEGQNVMQVYSSIQNPIDLREGISGEDLSAIVEASDGKLNRSDFSYVDPYESWQFFDDEFGKNFTEAAKAAGFDGAIMLEAGPDGNKPATTYVAFDAAQVKSATGNNGQFDGTNPDIRFSRASSPHSWDAPEQSKFDDLVYKLQDKQIDTKRVVEEIRKTGKALADEKDVYLQEELFHGRAAARTEDFVNNELSPLITEMKMRGIDIATLDEYLHARHAQEANELIADRNPEIQDGGSGMTTKAARDYLAKLDPAERKRLEAVAAKVDAILGKTRQMYADYNLESQATVNGWGQMFKNYVPLMREDKDGSMGIGQGFSIKGKETKGRTGSTRKVVDILANIAMQRERAIVRGEKNRVATALVGLAEINPNEDFWAVGPPPTEKVYDPKSNMVVDRADPLFKSRENVVVAKVKEPSGEVVEKAVRFNEDNERAVRMAVALKNLDAAQLNGLLGVSAKISRYFAAINTQYNPIFGVVNLVRDVQGAILNLTTTPLKDKKAEIAGHTLAALKGVYLDARAAREGKPQTSAWAKLWEDFQNEGGQTGYRDMFANSNDRAKAIEYELNPTKWMDSPLGKVFTANGTLKVPLEVAQKKAEGLFGWLSDYNLAMENAVRLSAYKVGLEQGMSKQQAASLAKNLTVNFNRKGQVGQQAGAVYAFFNASMQGSARLGKTLFDMDGSDPKTIRLSDTGKKIVYGGILLGVIQSLTLAAAGFDDEEPPEFVRERSLIIPTGGKSYITIPMPLGLHVLPNMGRIPTEFVLGGFKQPVKSVVKLLGLTAGAFNPIGGGASLTQMLAPTAVDPLVALAENKDWTGKPIAKTSYNKATPGFALTKDTASAPSKVLAEAINTISGGTKYTAGVLSPTPDQIDYLWGQVTGGVGRELSKAQQSASAMVSGEDLPIHKIPLLGRFYGDADTQSAQSSKFYSTINRLNEHEAEIKGLRKDRKAAELAEYMRDNPEARMFETANKVELEVQKMRRMKRELIALDAPPERIKALEERITQTMTRFNERAAAFKKQREAEAAQ